MRDPIIAILLKAQSENTTNIKNAIIILTGLKPMEKVMPNKYIVKVGIVKPIIVEYDRLQDPRPVKDMRRLALTALLVKVCEKMVDFKEFIVWSVNNKTFINKQN